MARNERATALFYADGRQFVGGLDRMEKRMGGFKRTVSRALGGLKSMAGFGGIAGLVGGGAGLASIASAALDYDESLTRLGISSGASAADLAVMQKRMNEVSRATGVGRSEVLKSVASFVALTGDVKGAAAQMELFARVNVGTKSSMEDITASAAALAQNLKILPADMEKAFSILIAGGKAGKIELKNVASLMAGLSPLMARFKGGSGVEGLADLGASFQLAAQGFGSAEQAATGLESLMGSIVQHAPKLEKAGVKVFDVGPDGTKTLRGFLEIVEAIGNSKLAKNPTLLIDALGRKEAEMTLMQLSKIPGAVRELAAETMKATDVQADYNAMSQSGTGKIKRELNSLTLKVQEAFTPERIQAFAAALGGALAAAEALLLPTQAIAGFVGKTAAWFNPTETQQTEAGRQLNAGASDDDLKRRIAFGERMSNLPGGNAHRSKLEQDVRELQRRERERELERSNFRFGGEVGTPLAERDSQDASARRSPARVPGDMNIKISMDPSTTNMKGQMDNHPSNRR